MMQMTCEQFETLMSFYLDGELGENIKNAFEAHLRKCKVCREKYNTFKKIIFELRNTYKTFNKSESVIVSNSDDFKINSYISAYVDNELDVHENVKIKKMIISKPEIRKKIEDIYNLQLLMKNSFEKTFPKEDFSRRLLRKIYKSRSIIANKDILFAIISFIILSVVWIIMLIASIRM